MWYGRRLRIWETNYGRTSGWVVKRQGVPIAILTDCRWEEVFWDSYRLEIITDDPDLQAKLLMKEFWAVAEAEGLSYRNLEFADAAPFAFPSLSPLSEPGRLMMRGLYLDIGQPGPFDSLMLWCRRRWRARAAKHRLRHRTSGSRRASRRSSCRRATDNSTARANAQGHFRMRND
jgi:hypothetical protein